MNWMKQPPNEAVKVLKTFKLKVVRISLSGDAGPLISLLQWQPSHEVYQRGILLEG